MSWLKLLIPAALKNQLIKLIKRCETKGLTLKSGVILDKHTKFAGYNSVHESSFVYSCSIGMFSYIGRQSTISNAKIGSFCSIGPGVKIGLGQHPASGFVSTHPLFYSLNTEPCGVSIVAENLFEESSEVTIRNDVWIGANVIIMDGVTVGNGAIIASGSVVLRDIEDFEVVAGVPAKKIKERFSVVQQRMILESSWWEERDLEVLKSKVQRMRDVGVFCENEMAVF